MDGIDRLYEDFRYWPPIAKATYGDIVAIWYGYRGESSPGRDAEHNLAVYNAKTRRIIYSEALPVGMSAEYDVETIAKEIAEGTFEPHSHYGTGAYALWYREKYKGSENK